VPCTYTLRGWIDQIGNPATTYPLNAHDFKNAPLHPSPALFQPGPKTRPGGL
jgi:hypothetical protein